MKTISKSQPDCVTCRACTQTVFTGLTQDELKELSDKKKCFHFRKDEYIFREGEEPGGLFCLHDGNVKVSKIDESGKEQIVRLVKRGNFLGYRALLCNDIYHANGIALEDCNVCFFRKDVYLGLLYSRPEMASHTIQVLTSDLRFAENMMMNIALKHVKGRIAEVLLQLEEFYGIYEKDNTINTNLRREDIGHLVGTTTETSIRVISELNKSGVIELVGKRIRITDRPKLMELSNRQEFVAKK